MQSWWSLQFEDVCANSLWHLCSLVTRNKVILAKPFLLCTVPAQFVILHPQPRFTQSCVADGEKWQGGEVKSCLKLFQKWRIIE